MASHFKNRFVQLCQNLQDPRHVATFQQFCGVRGRFSRDLSEIGGQKLQNGYLCYQGESDKANFKGGGDGRTADVAWKRRYDAAATCVDRDIFKNGLSNGALLITGAGDAAPLGANSGVHVGKGTGETSQNIPDDGRIFDRNVDGVGEDSSCGSTLKPRRKNSLTGDVGQEFLIENKLLYYLFSFGTELGNELFYITFFPFFIWNIDPFVGRRLILVWVWVMYLGQCTKDVIGWSRPASPPVVKVEMFYNSEYSMPSTHAMSGTAIPFSLFLLTYGRWEYPAVLGLVLALSWCVLVCMSRIYMGMHSILDVIVGFLYSVVILVLFWPALDVVDTFNQSYPFAPLVIVSLHVGLGLFSFTLDTWSTSRGDTAQILGTGAGIALGAHLNCRLGLLPDPPLDQLPFALPNFTAALVGMVVLRLVLGIVVLLAIRAAMKAVTIPLLCRVTGIPGDDVRKARQHMEVELPYRYIVYGSVGFGCTFLVPLFFILLGVS